MGDLVDMSRTRTKNLDSECAWQPAHPSIALPSAPSVHDVHIYFYSLAFVGMHISIHFPRSLYSNKAWCFCCSPMRIFVGQNETKRIICEDVWALWQRRNNGAFSMRWFSPIATIALMLAFGVRIRVSILLLSIALCFDFRLCSETHRSLHQCCTTVRSTTSDLLGEEYRTCQCQSHRPSLQCDSEISWWREGRSTLRWRGGVTVLYLITLLRRSSW